jgi:cyanophycinase-like exopeptidase
MRAMLVVAAFIVSARDVKWYAVIKDAPVLIARQDKVANRLICHRAHAAYYVLRHDRRGLSIDNHHCLVVDNDAGVRVVLGSIGVSVGR